MVWEFFPNRASLPFGAHFIEKGLSHAVFFDARVNCFIAGSVNPQFRVAFPIVVRLLKNLLLLVIFTDVRSPVD